MRGFEVESLYLRGKTVEYVVPILIQGLASHGLRTHAGLLARCLEGSWYRSGEVKVRGLGCSVDIAAPEPGNSIARNGIGLAK